MNLATVHLLKKIGKAKTLKDLKELIPKLIEELEFAFINELEARLERLEEKRNRTRRIRR